MIDKIQFKNYKIFSKEQTLNLKPITVIFGKNNSGKSAVLKLPMLISSSFNSQSNEVFEQEVDDIDLCSDMRDIVYGMANKAVEIRISDSTKEEMLGYRFFVDTTKEQKTHIEWWKLTQGTSSWEVSLEDNDQYVTSDTNLLDLHFKGIRPDTLHLPEYVEEVLKDLRFNIDYIGSVRMRPARDMRIKQINENKSGKDGEDNYYVLINDSLTLEKKILNKVSKWYENNFEGWNINVDKSREPIYHIEMVNGNIHTNILDTGAGIVQSLPILIRTYRKCSKPTLIVIEEPETHLHPAAHGDMGELFVESIKEDSQKKYLIETHSNNLIMRLRRLVAEGKISKEDIALYSVEFDSDEVCSNLRYIQIRDDGSVSDWPKGVFEESLQEAIAIRNAQLNKKK